MSIEYPIRVVARLTDLPVATLRAWERRYGAVRPERNGRGRVYTEGDVQRLLRLRQAVDRGHAIGQVAHLSDERLEELLAGPDLGRALPWATTRQVEKLSTPAEPILDAIARFDFRRADRELSRLASLLPTRDLVHEVILPLMRAVGERWHRGEFSVSQEHMASAITRNLSGSVMRLHQSGTDSRRILVTAPAGEIHELGILAAALLAAAMQLEVTYLGPNLPGREIVDAASRAACDVVLVGVSNPEPSQEIVDEVHLVARSLPSHVELWVGGATPATILSGVKRANVIALPDFETLEDRLKEVS
jgi:MerR family transcriptional regulator, light-induced transcriptional regulator